MLDNCKHYCASHGNNFRRIVVFKHHWKVNGFEGNFIWNLISARIACVPHAWRSITSLLCNFELHRARNIRSLHAKIPAPYPNAHAWWCLRVSSSPRTCTRARAPFTRSFTEIASSKSTELNWIKIGCLIIPFRNESNNKLSLSLSETMKFDWSFELTVFHHHYK